MRIFVDTSALLAALDEGDPNHAVATRMLEGALQYHEPFTHNYIHVEAEQLVRRRLGALHAARLLFEVLPAIETIWVGEDVHREAVAALFGKGRAESIVDHVSFALMRKLNVTSALAFDADFEREGFQRPDIPHTLSEAKAAYGGSPTSDLVSVAELAARSGRSVNTIQSWRRRHADFPAPNVELAAGPIWLWSDVSTWIDRRAPRSAGAGR